VSEQGSVLACVRYAHAGASVTLDVIAIETRLPRRAVEQAVQALRLQGEPLVSDGDGIRYSTDPAEVKACAEALRRRLATQYLTSRALRRTARRMESVKELVLGL
jgi:hypothetical protein